MNQPAGSARRRTMAEHSGTCSVLVSASELALSAWLNKEQDPEQALHATNILAYVLETIQTDLPPPVHPAMVGVRADMADQR